MGHRKKISNKTKKEIVIGLLCVIVLLIVMIISAILYFVQDGMNEKNNNILYYSENQNKEENNMIVVELEDKNETNEVNETNESNNVIDQNTTNTINNDNSKDIPYYIKVNNQANTVTVYKKDANGKYTVPVKAMVCSIGDATPEKGVYSMSDKYTWRFLQGNVYGQYACRITGHILFHSVPYTKKDKSTLEWWEYDKLGTKASLGCIRLTVQDAKWIYDNCVSGTKVEFYSDSNPGPLGKPSAKKISDDESVRNWDPTDPDKKNPWKNYTPDENNQDASESDKSDVNTNQNNTAKPNLDETNSQNAIDTSTNVFTDNANNMIKDNLIQ